MTKSYDEAFRNFGADGYKDTMGVGRITFGKTLDDCTHAEWDAASKAVRQPKPKPNHHQATWGLVIADMALRNNVGVEKYGTPLQPFNGRNSLQDAYEEVLDLAVYLKNAIIEAEK